MANRISDCNSNALIRIIIIVWMSIPLEYESIERTGFNRIWKCCESFEYICKLCSRPVIAVAEFSGNCSIYPPRQMQIAQNQFRLCGKSIQNQKQNGIIRQKPKNTKSVLLHNALSIKAYLFGSYHSMCLAAQLPTNLLVALVKTMCSQPFIVTRRQTISHFSFRNPSFLRSEFFHPSTCRYVLQQAASSHAKIHVIILLVGHAATRESIQDDVTASNSSKLVNNRQLQPKIKEYSTNSSIAIWNHRNIIEF